MLTLLLFAAASANPWLDRDPDVVAEARISAPPEQVYAHLVDVSNHPDLLSCASNWELGEQTAGEGATWAVRWDLALMRRSLQARLVDARPAERIDLDHQGPKGFVTRIGLEPDGDGTRVRAHTYLNPPPWPLRRYYFTRIRPLWVQCWNDALVRLDDTLGG